LAKTRALETEGITAYMLTGSYEVPVNNLTGDIRRDIILIDKIIGVGEIALSDHRSSQPTKDEMKRIATQARVGGMLSGKCGIVQLHMGVGANGLNMIFDIVNETEIPVKHFIPTHVNRKAELLQQAMEFAKMGGYIDLTSGIRPEDGFDESIKPSKAIKMCVENNVPMDRITMSSDGNGSMAVYNKNGFVERLLVTTLDSLHDEFRLAVLDEGVDISTAVKIITGNVANALKLYPAKGNIGVGADADILLLNEQLEIEYVIAMGKKLMENKKVIVKGTFEE
jgi:beta-aspartyl-dipeptidase (metallo-type)